MGWYETVVKGEKEKKNLSGGRELYLESYFKDDLYGDENKTTTKIEAALIKFNI